jgi:formate C-acetyltransferase
MYTFRSASKRILDQRERIRDRVLIYEAQRAVIITEASKRYGATVPIIKRPLVFKEICEKLDLFVGDEDVIVGSKGGQEFTCASFPDWTADDWMTDAITAGEWTLEDDGLYHSPPNEELKQTISPADYQALLDTRSYWDEHRVGATADAWQPEFYEELHRLVASTYHAEGMSLAGLSTGHLIPGFQKIIRTGFKAIRDEAQAHLNALRGNTMGEDVNRYLFYQSVVITCEASSILIGRYAKAVRAKAEVWTEPVRKAELLRMADGLDNIKEQPASNFWEAIQLYMLYQVMLQIGSRIPAPALGRVDWILWPYLKKDLEAGVLTEDDAQEMVDAFFLKANCFYAAGPPALVNYIGLGNTYQHTTIGGVDPETGEDATNPLTYMVLETVGRLRLHDPTISLRFHKNSPDALWDCALATSKLVGGLPLYQNDEVIIPGLVQGLGFELKDARDYGIIGCQEIVGSGTDYPAPNGVFPAHCSVWWGIAFAMAINNGINPKNGEQAHLHTGYLYEMNSIEEVRQAVADMGRYLLKMYVSINNYAEAVTQYHCPEAILSLSIEGCMEQGRDVVDGGAKYNSYGGAAVGLATLADSLTTIKYMVFDKKRISGKDLLEAVLADWEGYEPLRQQILTEVPHFGNADPYADEEYQFVVELYMEICRECYSTRAEVYKAGLYGAADHVTQGYYTWATPDGRKAGEPIADAASPGQGRDKNGPTAVFRSALCFDHEGLQAGMALNMRMHPSVLSNDEGAHKLRDMTRIYFENGGLEVQYNVVDTTTLREAQSHPEEYRDLVVRIAGFSAYFIELDRDMQNDIISRNEIRF